MKRGFKKFLAMVSVVSLTSGVGALGCAAAEGEKLIASDLPVYYQLIKDKNLGEDQKKLFDTVKLGGTDYFAVKAGLSEDQKKLLDEALKLLNPFVVIEKSKVGNGSSKIGVSKFVVAAVGVVSAIIGGVAGFLAKMFLSKNQEGNA